MLFLPRQVRMIAANKHLPRPSEQKPTRNVSACLTGNGAHFKDKRNRSILLGLRYSSFVLVVAINLNMHGRVTFWVQMCVCVYIVLFFCNVLFLCMWSVLDGDYKLIVL